jgi:hypothetical protein
MKRLLQLACLVLPLAAQAAWSDLKPGMNRGAIVAQVGMPLLQNRGRGGAELWTFDRCGWLQLVNGRLLYWTPPREEHGAESPAPATDVLVSAPAITPAAKARPARHLLVVDNDPSRR